MLRIDARDGAGRTGLAQVASRNVEIPAVLWLDEELSPAEAQWEPSLSRRAGPTAFLVNTASFQAKAPTVASNQLLFRRQLEATPAMAGGKVRLHDLVGQVAVLSGAAALARNPRRLAPALAQARAEAGYGRLLYAPGLAEPSQLSLLAYAGVDLFDAVPASLAAARGIYLTSHGAFPAARLERPECSCPACQHEPPAGFTEEELRRHNQYAVRNELGVVRNAIRAGRLRELVEARVRAHPELTALLRRLDQQGPYLEERTPLTRREPMFANTKESLRRPETIRFRTRLRERYEPRTSAPILLLLPCSHRKPYSRSRTHRSIDAAVYASGAATLVHEVIVTSPLGIVPRELELTYPAAHYDVPVTGEWDEEEGAIIRELVEGLLSKRRYERVVSHLPPRTHALVEPVMPEGFAHTCSGSDATRPPELDRLRAVLKESARGLRARPHETLMRERLAGLATYQFGPTAAAALLEGTTAGGRWPVAKLVQGKEQLAFLPPERGLLSLTLAGAQRIAAAGVYRVGIEDFPVTGSVFAVGVKGADPQIRVGDEVVVVHGDEVRAVGVAAMTGPEMVELSKGEAVKVRHHA